MMLEFINTDYAYHTLSGETEAVKVLSFSIVRGQFVSVIGPSGCGKTTILSLAAGLIAPTGGEVKRAEDWLNNYPRGILGFDTPENLFNFHISRLS